MLHGDGAWGPISGRRGGSLNGWLGASKREAATLMTCDGDWRAKVVVQGMRLVPRVKSGDGA